MNFEGKCGIVTGAGSGIGRATAEKLAKLGAKLLLVDYNTDALQETVELIKPKNREVYGFQANIADVSQVRGYVEKAIQLFGKIDFFHNNAGVLQKPSNLHEIENDEFERVINVNLKGAYYGLKYILQQMVRQQSGAIVNTSSHAGIRAEPYLGVYAATKHALSGLTVTAACEYGAQGIRVKAVCPGGVKTNMTVGMLEQNDKSSYGPMQRAASPNEIADAVTYLLSEEASYINGVLLPVDGGLSS
ncbi:SDR family NAD(P)-dependent oxidoreductase [Heyndrickxia oleronia]|uniref:SDR family NAD(P)-dependent oxidoreductase n=1 Tax=Heyndrickxia oleronia TaxID=38875 RepID=A0AAW6SL27_9BACI|nr:SDR family oxidoreductase [Heyndrickxia oleronia]MDH5159446.1 SDR family NAD(P)-dependent oxidoreductase [Heyndrickxia oleronia]